MQAGREVDVKALEEEIKATVKEMQDSGWEAKGKAKAKIPKAEGKAKKQRKGKRKADEDEVDGDSSLTELSDAEQ